LLAGISIMSIQ